MPYAFQRGEPVPAAVRRIMDEQIVRATAALTGEGVPLETRIHDARKRFKEIRALLRMVRTPLGGSFAVENLCYRDAGRALSGARDAAAVLESLDKLAAARKLPRTALRRTRGLLRARLEAADTAVLAERIASVLERLTVARARVALWPELDDSFDTLGEGLLRTYRDGRRALEAAAAGGMPHQYHEWRKRAKEHWYHAQLLRHVWPDMMKAWTGVLEELSRALGDQHDLVVLRQTVAVSHTEIGRRPSVVALLDAIAARQLELEAEARAIGRRVYAERPRAWLARIENLWNAWRT